MTILWACLLVFDPGSLSLLKSDVHCHANKTVKLFKLSVACSSSIGWVENLCLVARYVDTSLLTVTFLSISVDLLIFIIFTFAHQMANYDERFRIKCNSP